MTNRFKTFNFISKANEHGNNNYRNQDCSASRSYLDFTSSRERINTDCQGRFIGNHSITSPCIKSHFKKNRRSFIDYLGPVEYYSFSIIKPEFAHRLESCCITLGQGICRIFHKKVLSLMQTQQFLIDLIPVRTVEYKPSGDRCSGRFIDFIYSYKQPFTMKPLFNSCNLFSFHIHAPRKNFITGEVIC
jgi:hypothetical protein